MKFFFTPEWTSRQFVEDAVLCWAWTLPKRTQLSSAELVASYNAFAERTGAPPAPSSNILTRVLVTLGAKRWHTESARGIRTPGYQMSRVLRGPVTGRVAYMMDAMAQGRWAHADIMQTWAETVVETRGPTTARLAWVEMVMVYLGATPVDGGLLVGSTMPAEV